LDPTAPSWHPSTSSSIGSRSFVPARTRRIRPRVRHEYDNSDTAMSTVGATTRESSGSQ
jgi:hypothetical protein